MKIKQVLLLALISVLVAGQPAFAKERADRGNGPGPGGEKVMAETEKKAGLTEEQREKIKALREEFKKTQETLRAQLKTKREAVRQEMDSENPNRQKAEALVDDMIKIQAQLEKGRLEHIFAIRAIMTPEQFQKIRTMMEERRKNRGKGNGFEKGKRRGPGEEGFRGGEDEGPRMGEDEGPRE